METTAMRRRDRSYRGKEEAIRLWTRQGNRRERRDERQEVLDRLCEMDPRLDALDAIAMGERDREQEYRWEAGYRGNEEDVLPFWQDSCSCEACGRYLPAGQVFGRLAWDDGGYYRRERYVPIAHVDHEGRPCVGGQVQARRSYLVFDVQDVIDEEERARRELEADLRHERPCPRGCGLDARWCAGDCEPPHPTGCGYGCCRW